MVFAYWARETQLSSFRRCCDQLSRLALACPEGVGICQVVGLEAVPPSTETRGEITKLMKDSVGGRLIHYSIVHEGTGFKAASVRAIVSASHMLANTATHLAVFNSITEAAKWHAKEQAALKRRETFEQIAGVIYALQKEHQAYLSKSGGLEKSRT